jgi:hypothetical protein
LQQAFSCIETKHARLCVAGMPPTWARKAGFEAFMLETFPSRFRPGYIQQVNPICSVSGFGDNVQRLKCLAMVHRINTTSLDRMLTSIGTLATMAAAVWHPAYEVHLDV